MRSSVLSAAAFVLTAGCSSTVSSTALHSHASPGMRKTFDVQITETSLRGKVHTQHQRLTLMPGKLGRIRTLSRERMEIVAVTYDGGDVATVEVTRDERAHGTSLTAKRRIVCKPGERTIIANQRDATTGTEVEIAVVASANP
jgi:hypothetical protein